MLCLQAAAVAVAVDAAADDLKLIVELLGCCDDLHHLLPCLQSTQTCLHRAQSGCRKSHLLTAALPQQLCEQTCWELHVGGIISYFLFLMYVGK